MANVPYQRSRATDIRFGTETQSRGSLHPVCSATESTYISLPRKILIKNLSVTLKANTRAMLTNEGVLVPEVLFLESGKIQRAIQCEIVEPIG